MKLSIIDAQRCVGCQLCMFACARMQGFGGYAKARLEIRSRGGMRNGFAVIVCNACLDPSCSDACPTGALTKRKGGGVKFKPSLCNHCGACKTACALGAVRWDIELEQPLICIGCGYCVDFCPHGVLTRESEKDA